MKKETIRGGGFSAVVGKESSVAAHLPLKTLKQIPSHVIVSVGTRLRAQYFKHFEKQIGISLHAAMKSTKSIIDFVQRYK